MKKLVKISEAAKILNVHQNTLRNWDRKGKLTPVSTPGGHRKYLLSDIERLCGEEKEEKSNTVKVAIYCRVSSHDQKQKGDLERQLGRVSSYCIKKKYHIVQTYEEVGSGMNDNRTKLHQLFKLVQNKEIDKVIIEHKDRLTRFNFEFLKQFFISHGVEIVWIGEVLGKSYEEELVEDMLSLMSSFSNRIYGKRSAELRKQKKHEEESSC